MWVPGEVVKSVFKVELYCNYSRCCAIACKKKTYNLYFRL